MPDEQTAPTEEQVEQFEYLSPMLDSAHAEMREFAKKKQDGIVSKTKIEIVNRLLRSIVGLLAREDSVKFLDRLDEEQLPQNSDVVLVLGQYQAAMRAFKEKHFRAVHSYHKRWITQTVLETLEREKSAYEPDPDDEFAEE